MGNFYLGSSTFVVCSGLFLCLVRAPAPSAGMLLGAIAIQ